MSFLDSMNISASALTATRLRMDIVAENIANSNTTMTSSGEAYRRKYVVFQEKTDSASAFSTYLNKTTSRYGGTRALTGGGVKVAAIGEDQTDFTYDYDPTHPDANEDGYVAYPNVEVVKEMVDMMSAYRAYEANITALNTFKDMAVKTLELGQG